MGVQKFLYMSRESGVEQGACGDVHRDGDRASSVGPLPDLAQREAQHLGRERMDYRGVLSERDELVGLSQSHRGMMPADEGFDTAQRAGASVDLGLVVQ